MTKELSLLFSLQPTAYTLVIAQELALFGPGTS